MDFMHNFRPEEVKREIKNSKKNPTVLSVGQISQGFQNKNTTTKIIQHFTN